MTVEHHSIIEKFAPKPLWLRSPEQFFGSHRTVLAAHLRDWPTGEPLVLSKFVASYLDGLPIDMPAETLMKLTQLAIDFFEKQKAGSDILAPA